MEDVIDGVINEMKGLQASVKQSSDRYFDDDEIPLPVNFQKRLTPVMAELSEEEMAELLAPIEKPMPIAPELSEEELAELLAPVEKPMPITPKLSKEELAELLAPAKNADADIDAYEEDLDADIDKDIQAGFLLAGLNGGHVVIGYSECFG